MSWLSDQMEKRERFHERFPNGTQADWVKFNIEESMQRAKEELDPEEVAAKMINPHKIPKT